MDPKYSNLDKSVDAGTLRKEIEKGLKEHPPADDEPASLEKTYSKVRDFYHDLETDTNNLKKYLASCSPEERKRINDWITFCYRRVSASANYEDQVYWQVRVFHSDAIAKQRVVDYFRKEWWNQVKMDDLAPAAQKAAEYAHSMGDYTIGSYGRSSILGTGDPNPEQFTAFAESFRLVYQYLKSEHPDIRDKLVRIFFYVCRRHGLDKDLPEGSKLVDIDPKASKDVDRVIQELENAGYEPFETNMTDHQRKEYIRTHGNIGRVAPMIKVLELLGIPKTVYNRQYQFNIQQALMKAEKDEDIIKRPDMGTLWKKYTSILDQTKHEVDIEIAKSNTKE